MFSERANAEMKSELKITMKQMPKSARETQMNDRKKNYFFSKTTDSYLGHSHALCMHTLFSSCYFSLFNSSNYMKCDIDLTAGTSVSVCLTNFYSYMRRLCVRFFEIYFHATCTAWRCVFKCAWTASSTFITILFSFYWFCRWIDGKMVCTCTWCERKEKNGLEITIIMIKRKCHQIHSLTTNAM